MKKMNVQRGDAMVMLVIVLAVALGGVVGWVAYDKMFNTQDTAEVADTPAKVAEETPEVAKLQEACAPYEKLCFEYPEGWKIDVGESELDGKKIDVMTVSSPTNEVTLKLNSGISGMGGACFPEEYGKVYRVKNQATKLTGYTPDEWRSSDVRVMALVVSNLDETKFVIGVELTNSKELVNNEVSSACNAAFSALIDGKNAAQYDGVAGKVIFSTGVGPTSATDDLLPPSKQYASLSEAKKALESEEWKQAFDILASAHYK